jgi:hypothetical protein
MPPPPADWALNTFSAVQRKTFAWPEVSLPDLTKIIRLADRLK